MIIIVDDEDAITDSLIDFLKKKKLNVLGSYGFHEAKKLIEEGNIPSILLTDFHMPDGSGLDLINLVKSINSDSKCFLLTGNADRSEEEYKKNGVDFVVLKPFTKKYIFQRIEEVLKN